LLLIFLVLNKLLLIYETVYHRYFVPVNFTIDEFLISIGSDLRFAEIIKGCLLIEFITFVYFEYTPIVKNQSEHGEDDFYMETLGALASRWQQ